MYGFSSASRGGLPQRRRYAGSSLAVLTLVASLLTTLSTRAVAATAVPPVAQRNPTTGVTADGLPTVQINGVVWSEKVVGNTVYAGGNFSAARPAGVALGGAGTVTRNNLLAFNLTTGNLITSFAPSLNGQVKMVAVSPDGSRVYVGGSFTTANGANRYRLAAYDVATGALVSTFKPVLDASVNAITATNTTVYIGGNFSSANGVPRSHLAAFSASSGALLSWAPSSDDIVQALVITPDGTRVIAGGAFTHLNGISAYGMGSLDAKTGASYPWAANSVVKDAGTGASILTLTTDGTYIYSTAYVYTSTGNFEGVMSADPTTGAIHWLADCHGDTYGSYGVNGVVYVASHEHYCSPVGGFPDTNPRTVWHRATAFTQNATGVLQTDTQTGGGYGNFAGKPSPSLVNWIPDFDIGTFTHQNQGPWSVSGNTQYLVYGGEFLHVNGVAQQGLVRFAVPAISPHKSGPQVSGANVVTTVAAASFKSVKISWQTNWDRDDQLLTYNIYRSDKASTSLTTVTATSQLWNRPTLSFIDTTALPNTTYSYRVKTSDGDGNVAYGNSVSVTTPAS